MNGDASVNMVNGDASAEIVPYENDYENYEKNCYENYAFENYYTQLS